MILRLIRLAVAQPQLLADHADAYAELAAAELGDVSTRLKRQTLFLAAALCSLSVAMALGGVAVMLWAVTPPAQIHTPWALAVVPLLPAVIALGCVLAARRAGRIAAFAAVRRQVRADMAMLHETGTA